MPTAQQRLRKWYRSESLLWRSVAVAVKAVVEGAVFVTVATGIAAVFYPVVTVGALIPGEELGLATIWVAIVGFLARTEWCFTTRSQTIDPDVEES